MRVGTAVGCVALVLAMSILMAPRRSWSTDCSPNVESLRLELISVAVDGELQPVLEFAGGHLDVRVRQFQTPLMVEFDSRWRPGGRYGTIAASRMEVFVDETNHSGR